MACSSPTSDPRSPAAQQIFRQQANEYILGKWILMTAEPSPPLEPALHRLLAAQLGRMILTFQDGTMRADGVGIGFTRRYQVTEAFTNRCTLMVQDDYGSTIRVDGEFQDRDTMVFWSRTPPFQATGTLKRSR